VPVLRVALAQVNMTVGDLPGNVAAVLHRTGEAADLGADLVAFPELMLTGYPPEDLVLRRSFRTASRTALDKLAGELGAAGLGGTAVIVGFLTEDDGARNAAAVLLDGRVVATYYKHHLPNYGVFDEQRYFEPGETFLAVELFGASVGITVCEDVWQDGGPFATARNAGVGLMVNINSSPFERDKGADRLALLRRRAAEAGTVVAYVNTVGGQDELVFDGDSMVVAPDGEVLLRAPIYDEGLYCLDVHLPGAGVPGEGPMPVRHVTTGTAAPAARAPLDEPEHSPELGDEARVWGALVVGLRDYARKNGFGSVVLGMSGGIDSAVVAALAADALGGPAVYGVSMPSQYSSEHSRDDASDLADRLGAHYQVVPIAGMVEQFVTQLGLSGLAEENVQARVRGTTLMALSNAHGHLVLATGNKSELAVGYSTIYGDAVGGFAPIKDVPKSLVWRLAQWRNEQARLLGLTEPIPPNSITKPPSAELRPGQLDSDSLPDYAELDAVLARYVDADEDVAEIIAAGFDAALVQRIAGLVDAAEWKRRQYPPGPKISFKAFGKDRRLPITNRWRESGDAG
jgi:NAD+ synthase (glutamine-hydrolysing)